MDKSLVQVDDSGERARYRLLETIRDYAAAQLAHAGEETDTTHASPGPLPGPRRGSRGPLEGFGQIAWIARLAADYPNLRAALAWSRSQGDVEALARMAAALPVYWNIHGPNTDGAAWLDALLEGDDRLPPGLRAKALWARAELAQANFDVATTGLRAQEGMELAKQLGDSRMTCRFFAHLAQVRLLMGQPDATIDEAVDLARQLGDAQPLAFSLMLKGAARINVPADAARWYEEARRVAEAAGNVAMANLAAGFQGVVLWYLGEPLRARALCDRVAAAAESVGDRNTVAMTLMYAGMVTSEADQRHEALAYAKRLERVAAELDLQLWKTFVPILRSQVALAGGDRDAALRLAREAADLAHIPVTTVNALPALIEAEIATGLAGEAHSHLDELTTLGHNTGYGYSLAWAFVLRAVAFRLEREREAAETAANQAFTVALELGAKTRITDALEVLAGLAADAGARQEAARMFGAAQRLRDDTGYRRCVSTRDADIEALRAALGRRLPGRLRAGPVIDPRRGRR